MSVWIVARWRSAAEALLPRRDDLGARAVVLDGAQLVGGQVGVADDPAVLGDKRDPRPEDLPQGVGFSVQLRLGRRAAVGEDLRGHPRFDAELAFDPLFQAPPDRPRHESRRHEHAEHRRGQRGQEDLGAEGHGRRPLTCLTADSRTV